MEGIENVLSIPGGATPADSTRSPTSDIDQDGFLRLLIAQLQNQDPLEPLSNGEFVSQLTQFSSLDELRGIKNGLSGLEELGDITQLLGAGLALQQTSVNAMAVGLIGKDVEVFSNAVTVGGPEGTEIAFDNTAGATSMTLELKDTSGETIYSLSFDPSSPPDGVRVEDGRIFVEVPTQGSDGQELPPGIAEIVVKANTTTGEIPLETTILGKVSGIDFRGNATLLTVGGTPVDIINVLAVRSSDENK